MSIQLDYFACRRDSIWIAERILEVFPDLFWCPERGRRSEVVCKRVESAECLAESHEPDMRVLVPADCEGEVSTTDIGGGLVCIRVAENPVIEFSPSLEEGDAVRIGRVYYAYESAAELRKRVQQLLRLLKRGASPYLDKKALWIFPGAMETAENLRQWVGPIWRNAMFQGRKG